MRFSITSSLYYHAFEPSIVICSMGGQSLDEGKILSEQIETNLPEVTPDEIVVGLEANRLFKFEVPRGDFSVSYKAVVETAPPLLEKSGLRENPAGAFDATVFPYLHASRYVPSDRMRSISHELFGKLETQLEQVLAIEEWLNQNLYYRVGTSTEQSWALDTFESRTGVCRDFAHLGIGFCRALNIPARYATVYAYLLNPQDFHAVFEAFVGGSWILLDGTRLAPLNGMVRIATGRDASETAVGNLYGNIQGQSVQAWIEPAESEAPNFMGTTRADLEANGNVIQLC